MEADGVLKITVSYEWDLERFSRDSWRSFAVNLNVELNEIVVVAVSKG
jgi:hypothetical protein